MSIRLRVTIITSVIATVVCLASLFLNITLTQSYLNDVTNDDMFVVANIADEYMTASINLLKANAQSIASKIDKLPDSKKNKLLNDLTDCDPWFSAISIIDGHGVVYEYGDYPIPASLGNPDYARMAFDGKSIISTTRKEKDGNIVFHICVPMNNNRVLAATIDGMFFADLLKRFKLWDSSYMFMLDSEGTVIASINKEWMLDRVNFTDLAKTDKTFEGLGGFAKKMRLNKSFSGQYEFKGSTHIGVSVPIKGSLVGWSLGLVSPIEHSPLVKVHDSLIITSMIFIIACIVISILASRQISLPMETNAKLSELKEEAELASETKSAFLANTSHEMRTPLNAIIGLSELQLSEDDIAPSVRENLTKINSSGTVLLNIINDLLDISKIESGKFELIDVEYYMPSLVNDTVNLNLMRLKSKPLEFKINIDPNIPNRLYGDELRVKQIFNNLLSNACKYTESGVVEWKLWSEQDGDDVWLISSVRDTGIGICPEDIKRLFTDYNQVNVKSNRKIEGTGLGLSIVKRLVTMMDGEINVESEYGKGSTFTVRVRQKRIDDAVIGTETVENIKRFRYFEHKRNIGAKFNRINLSYAKVLIVDDVVTNLDVAKGMMKPYGMTIDCVISGKGAIERIRSGERYNAVFMDHMMPGMDGVEAVRIIREEIDTEYARTVPIIALTANAIKGNEETFLNNGFQAFLSKPIDMMKLDFIIKQWVRDREYEQEHNLEPDATAEKPAHTSVDALANCNIAGLDTDSGIKRFGGNADIYLDVLSSYATNTKGQLDELANTVRVGAMDTCAIMFHGIKGSSRGISAETVGAEAETLEIAAKSGNRKYVEDHIHGFIAETDALITAITEMLRSATAQNEKPLKDRPDGELLKKLASACNRFSMDDADITMNELEQFHYKEDGSLVTWLREKVNTMNFEEIVAHLSNEGDL